MTLVSLHYLESTVNVNVSLSRFDCICDYSLLFIPPSFVSSREKEEDLEQRYNRLNDELRDLMAVEGKI